MPSVTVLILLTFISQADANDSMDTLVNNLVDKLMVRAKNVWPLQHTDLEDTTLDKASGSPALRATPAAFQSRVTPSLSQAPLSIRSTSLSSGQLPMYGTMGSRFYLPHRTVSARSSSPDTMEKTSEIDAPAADKLDSRTVSAGVLPYQGSLSGVDKASCSAQLDLFKGMHSGAMFAGTLDALAAAGKIPPQFQEGFKEMQSSYKDALSKSGKVANPDKESTEVIAAIADRVVSQFKDPYTFPSRHERILEPFNYYQMLQRFSGNLIDFDTSFVGHAERILEMKQAIERGENVLILANHQTEADPGIWSWMTESLAPNLANDMFYVAGDRVVLDPLAKPFSMGRNLICVHSKRHAEDDPALRAAKMRTNQKSVGELGKLFKKGGAIVWVAPSGGRDRKDASGEYVPADFDPSAVMLLKRMLDKSDKPGHVYPMAMVSAEIMPPPATVEKKLGEKRVIEYHGVGISIGKELDDEKILGGIEGKSEKTEAYTKAAYEKVNELYAPLADVVYGSKEAGAEFTQPWKEVA